MHTMALTMKQVHPLHPTVNSLTHYYNMPEHILCRYRVSEEKPTQFTFGKVLVDLSLGTGMEARGRGEVCGMEAPNSFPAGSSENGTKFHYPLKRLYFIFRPSISWDSEEKI